MNIWKKVPQMVPIALSCGTLTSCQIIYPVLSFPTVKIDGDLQQGLGLVDYKRLNIFSLLAFQEHATTYDTQNAKNRIKN